MSPPNRLRTDPRMRSPSARPSFSLVCHIKEQKKSILPCCSCVPGRTSPSLSALHSKMVGFLESPVPVSALPPGVSSEPKTPARPRAPHWQGDDRDGDDIVSEGGFEVQIEAFTSQRVISISGRQPEGLGLLSYLRLGVRFTPKTNFPGESHYREVIGGKGYVSCCR